MDEMIRHAFEIQHLYVDKLLTESKTASSNKPLSYEDITRLKEIDSCKYLYDILCNNILQDYRKLLQIPVRINFFDKSGATKQSNQSENIKQKKFELEQRYHSVTEYLSNAGKLALAFHRESFTGGANKMRPRTRPEKAQELCLYCGSNGHPLIESESVHVCPDCFSCSVVVDNFSASSEFYKPKLAGPSETAVSRIKTSSTIQAAAPLHSTP